MKPGELENLSKEIELFWSATKAIAATGQRLEAPLKKEIEKSKALENQLHDERKRLQLSQKLLITAEERNKTLEGMLVSQQHKIDELQAQIRSLQDDHVRIQTENAKQAKLMEDSQAQFQQLQLRNEQLEKAIDFERKTVQRFSETLQKNQRDWNRVVENDKKMREINAALESKNQRITHAMERERKLLSERLRKEVNSAAELRNRLEHTLVRQTEIQAKDQELTQELNRYRQGWGQMMEHDRRLREMIAEQQARARKLLDGIRHYQGLSKELGEKCQTLQSRVGELEKQVQTFSKIPPPPPPKVNADPSQDVRLNALWEELIRAENSAEKAKQDSEKFQTLLKNVLPQSEQLVQIKNLLLKKQNENWTLRKEMEKAAHMLDEAVVEFAPQNQTAAIIPTPQEPTEPSLNC